MSSVVRRHVIVLIVVPASLALAGYAITLLPYTKYTRGFHYALVFLLLVDIAVALRGKLRDAVLPIASLVFCFAAMELVCAVSLTEGGEDAQGFSVSRAELGWGPSAAGVYRGFRETGEGNTIYDVNYTIDQNLLRQTESAPGESTVAVFGDSITFGQGVSDSQTLPQNLATLSDGKLRVLNFAFPGYGPQQFLRVLETGMFDPLLKDARIFVYQAVGWQVERASCRASYMARAPRYELQDEKLVYQGACAAGLRRIYNDVFFGSAIYRQLIAPRLSGADAHDVELFIAELSRCAELAKEKYGAQLIVLYSAESDSYLAKSGFNDARIKERLRRGGIDVLDDTLSAKDFPPGTVLAFPQDGHPTAVIHRARAKMLQDYLTSVRPSSPIPLN